MQDNHAQLRLFPVTEQGLLMDTILIFVFMQCPLSVESYKLEITFLYFYSDNNTINGAKYLSVTTAGINTAFHD